MGYYPHDAMGWPLCYGIRTLSRNTRWRGLRHTDCRADNFFHPPGAEEAGLIDFQMVLVLCVGYDVAYTALGSQLTEFWTPDEGACQKAWEDKPRSSLRPESTPAKAKGYDDCHSTKLVT